MDHGVPDVSILCYDLRTSGVVRNALHIAGAAHTAGLRTELWLARGGGLLRPEVPPGVVVVDAGHGGGPAPGRTLDLAMSVRPLAGYLKERRPRIVLSSGNHMHVAAALAHRLSRVSSRSSMVARASNATLRTPVAAYLGGHLPRIAATAIDLVNSLQYRGFDRIAAVSEELARAIVGDIGFAPEHVTVVPNGVDIEVVSRLAQAPVDEPWLIGGDVPVVLAVGRLSRQKNFGDLVRAVAIAGRSRPLRLIVLGDGPAAERLALERLAVSLGIAGHVKFAGHESNPYRYMARASVFAVSSLWEGASNVVIEALAAGLPVVGYRCPTGISEVLGPVAPDTLVPTGDVAGLAAAMLTQLSRPSDAAVLRARASRYTLTASLEAYVRLFRETIHGPALNPARNPSGSRP